MDGDSLGVGLGEGDVAERILVRNLLEDAWARLWVVVVEWVAADELEDASSEKTEDEASSAEEEMDAVEKLGKAPPTLATPAEV